MNGFVVLTSGGIDSTVALYWADNEVRKQPTRGKLIPLWFNYSQKHFEREYHCALVNTAHLEHPLETMYLSGDERGISKLFTTSALVNPEIKVPTITEVLGHPQPPSYVPFRNTLFLTIGCIIAEENELENVVYGAQLADQYNYWDTTKEFLDRFNHLIELNRLHEVKVVAPLVGKKKAEVILLGHSLGVNFKFTYSCYRGGVRHCGVCPTCSERRRGFIEANITDPTEYEQ